MSLFCPDGMCGAIDCTRCYPEIALSSDMNCEDCGEPFVNCDCPDEEDDEDEDFFYLPDEDEEEEDED
jgi:hypothetical protein